MSSIKAALRAALTVLTHDVAVRNAERAVVVAVVLAVAKALGI